MAFQSPTWIRMAYESDFDRWCKRLGIANEVATGDARFDDAVFITCDHPFVGMLLTASATLREAAHAAIREGYIVRYDGSFIWLVDELCDEPPRPSPSWSTPSA